MGSWAEDEIARQKGMREREYAIGASDLGYIGGGVSSVVSGLGEMFGMEPFSSAERFRRDYPISGVITEIGGAMVPYFGWEATLARAPRLAATLGGAAGRLGLTATTAPIRAGAINMAVRYSPVELSRLGVGLFTTDDWDKYSGLMADVGLSTMLAGGIGGLGGYLRSKGKSATKLGDRVTDSPAGLAAFAELRMSRAPTATTTGGAPMELVQQKLIRESLTERPLANKAIHALKENSEPRAVVGLNMLFKESNKSGGLIRQKLMQNDGTWTLGELGNQELVGGLGKAITSMDDIAEAGRFATKITVGSDRAAGTLRKAVQGLSPVGDGAWMGQEVGDGLFVTLVRTKVGEASTKAAQARAEISRQIAEVEGVLANPLASKGKLTSLKAAHKKLAAQLKKAGPANPIGAGDEFFAIKTDKPDFFIPGVPKSARLTVSQISKFRESYRPEVNQQTIVNQKQNAFIQTFVPKDLANIKAGHAEKARADWFRRNTSKIGEGLGLKNSEALTKLWDELYGAIAVPMAKGVRNSLYDRLFSMLQISKVTAESDVNTMVGGAVKAIRRKGFGGGFTQVHQPEIAPGVRPMNKVFGDNPTLTIDDRRLLDAISEQPVPEEFIASMTKNGQVSPAVKDVLAGWKQLDKWFWDRWMPVAESLGLEGKFSLVKGAYIPKILKGDNYGVVTDKGGKKVMQLYSGTRLQVQENLNAFVAAAKEKGLDYVAGPIRTWYHEGDDLLRLHQEMQNAVLKNPEIKDIASQAAKNMAVANAGVRPGVLRSAMPKTLSQERAGIPSSSGAFNEPSSVKELIQNFQQHYSMVAKYLAHESWKQRWMPELDRLATTDKKMAQDIIERARMMQGYEGKTAKFMNEKLAPVFGNNKAATKIAQETNSLMFQWNLGIFQPVFSLVNLLTPLQTTMPWVALMKYAPASADDLMHTTFRFDAAGKPSGLFSFLDPAKVMGQTLKLIGNPSDELLEFMGRAKTEGALAPQMFENFAGQGSAAATGIREAFHQAGGGVMGSWEAMKKIANWASTHSEEWSREFAFTAAYLVGRDMKGMSGEALFQFAKRGTHVTQYGYHAMDRSMAFTGPIGSMFGLFKNWQMHFISSMMQYAGLGWREGIWAPLIWQFAGSLAVGGLGATPLVLVADQITDWLDDQPNSYLYMKENFGGPDIVDELYYGFPAVFGLSLQTSSALPGTDVRNDLTMLSNFVFYERAKAAFKATKGGWDYFEQTGQNPLKNENVRDALLQGFAPRAAFRLFSVAENDAIKSMSSGYPQVRDVSWMSQTAYRLGLNPIEIEKQQDAARYLWREQTAQREAIAQHGARLAQAEMNRDTDEIFATIQSGMSLGLPMTAVTQSATTRVRREQQHDLLTKYGAKGALTRMALEEE